MDGNGLSLSDSVGSTVLFFLLFSKKWAVQRKQASLRLNLWIINTLFVNDTQFNKDENQ